MKNKEHITKLGIPRTAILNALIMLRDDTLNYLQGEGLEPNTEVTESTTERIAEQAIQM